MVRLLLVASIVAGVGIAGGVAHGGGTATTACPSTGCETVRVLPQEAAKFVGLPLTCIYDEDRLGVPKVICVNPTGLNRYWVEFQANRIVVKQGNHVVILSRRFR